MRILVIDDEDVVCRSCERVLGEAGHAVETTHGGPEGLARAAKSLFDVVLVDLKMPGMGGMEVLQKLRETQPDTDVLIITGHSTVETAVQAMKLGAFDYVCKPFGPDELTLVIGRVAEKRRLTTENLALQQELWSRYKLEMIVGTSRPMEEVFRRIAKVAPTTATVLITGESGTGKELVAKAVHFNSLRKGKPFIAVDCAGVPAGLLESELFGHVAGAFTGAISHKKGLFEVASGGTLFLDEVANVPLKIQAKLLRVLQEGEVRPIGDTRTMRPDVRIIAATNRPLDAMVKEGRFREDLYYRLNVFAIRVPPLRERMEDVPALAMHFVRKAGGPVSRISVEAMNLLLAHSWPGNVRELGNAIQGAAIVAESSTIKPEHLSPELRKTSSSGPSTSEELKEAKKNLRSESVEEIERTFVLEALEKCAWNVTRAAEQVGMQRTNFQALMKKHGVRLRNSGTDR